MDEFTIASLLEREKMEQFLPTFTTTTSFTNFQYKFSDATGYDNHDILIKYTTKDDKQVQAVGEVKVRYNHYWSGYYLEKQKLESLKAKYPDKTLYYFCISIAGVYVYNLSKIDFDTVTLSKVMLPKTSARQSKKVEKEVYTLPLTGSFVKYYEQFLV